MRWTVFSAGHNSIAKQLAQLMVALGVSTLLVGCGSSESMYSVVAWPGYGRYRAQIPRTLYVGNKKQSAWVMDVIYNDPEADWRYGSDSSQVLVFEPPPWSTKTVNRLMADAAPWQYLRYRNIHRVNLWLTANATIPLEYDAENRISHRPDPYPIWVVSIDPIVFANGEFLRGCPYKADEFYGGHLDLGYSVFVPRTEDLQCAIHSIVAFTGDYPEQKLHYREAVANDRFRTLTFENPITLGDLLDHPETWSDLLK